MYTGLLPRRQSDTSLATICASFRLARVNAHGGAVGACDNVVDSKPESRSTGIALGERLRRGLLDGHAEDLIGKGWTAKCAAQFDKTSFILILRSPGSSSCRPAPAP